MAVVVVCWPLSHPRQACRGSDSRGHKSQTGLGRFINEEAFGIGFALAWVNLNGLTPSGRC